MYILVLVISLTLLVSAACSLFEAVLYSTRLGILEGASESGRHRGQAKRFLQMKADIARPTAAILILNTLANTAGATIAGMLAVQLYGPRAVVVVSASLTIAILFLSEILPKTFGATRWKSIWPYVVLPLTLMERGLSPLIRVTQTVSKLVTGGGGVPTVTEDEIQATIHLGRKEGELTRDEQQLISAVFRFDDMVVRQILVPRRQVVILKASWSRERCVAAIRKFAHSRYPVCTESLDSAIGVLHVKDLSGAAADEAWTTLARPLRTIPETMKISRLLRQMQRTKQHMMIVTDEHGSARGIVTLENVLEQIVGEVQDEFDSEMPDFVPEGPDRYLVPGRLALDKINERLRLDLYSPSIDTIGGLLMTTLDRVPRVGEVVALPGVKAEVVALEGGFSETIRLTLSHDVPFETDSEQSDE